MTAKLLDELKYKDETPADRDKSINKDAKRNLDSLKYLPACLNEITAVVAESIHKTKPDINGAATFMQGYAARCGFGITLIRNHTVEAIPITIKITLSEI